jgi:ABC-type branched-subunit amino acid transport system permease subunit
MLAGLSHRYGILIVLAAVMALLPLTFPSGYYFRVASLVWVSAFAAIGLNILMGKAGQVSLGHAGFFGIGAYAVAIGPGRSAAGAPGDGHAVDIDAPRRAAGEGHVVEPQRRQP